MWMRSAIDLKRIARSLTGRDSPRRPDTKGWVKLHAAAPGGPAARGAGTHHQQPVPGPRALKRARQPPVGPSLRWLTIGSAGIDQVFQRRLDDPGVVVKLDRNGLLQNVLSNDLAVAFHRLYAFSLIGKGAFQFDVGGVFVLEATLEPSAHAGQARRIQRETLLARHLDRYRIEVAQP